MGLNTLGTKLTNSKTGVKDKKSKHNECIQIPIQSSEMIKTSYRLMKGVTILPTFARIENLFSLQLQNKEISEERGNSSILSKNRNSEEVCVCNVCSENITKIESLIKKKVFLS